MITWNYRFWIVYILKYTQKVYFHNLNLFLKWINFNSYKKSPYYNNKGFKKPYWNEQGGEHTTFWSAGARAISTSEFEEYVKALMIILEVNKHTKYL